MQIKATKRYHFRPVSMASIKKTNDKGGGNVKKREPLYTTDRNVNCCNYYGKQTNYK